MKKYLSIIFIIIMIISQSFAEQIFSDSFEDSTKIGAGSTVKREDGYVTIDSKYYPNAITVNSETTEYAVINDGKIEIYNMGETNARLVKTIQDKNVITNPIGISYASNQDAIWVLNDDGLVKYDINNESVVSKISGLSEVVGITNSNGYETVSILKEDGKVKAYKELIEGGISDVSALSFSGISNPLAVSAVGSADNVIMLNDDEAVYYEFNDSEYEFNPSLRVSVGNNAYSVSANENGFVILNEDKAEYYSVIANNAEKQTVYSVSDIQDGVGISLKQDGYEYAIIEADGSVKYYQYDGSEMKENEQLSTEGIKIPRKLILPSIYVSKTVNTENIYNEVTVSASQSVDSNSNITWYVDSGAGFEQVSVGAPTKIAEGNSFAIKAVLNIDDKNGVLPQINDVSLSVSNVDDVKIKKVEIIGATKNKDGQILPTSNFPVEIKRGSQVVFAVETSSDVTDVYARLYTKAGELKIIELDEAEDNRFIGTIKFEPDELEGEIIDAEFSTKPDYSVDISNFININSAVSYDLDLQLRE